MSVFLPCSVPPNSIPSWVQRALVMQTCSSSNDSGAQRLTQTQKRLQIMLQFIIHRNRLVYATRCQYQLDQQPEEEKTVVCRRWHSLAVTVPNEMKISATFVGTEWRKHCRWRRVCGRRCWWRLEKLATFFCWKPSKWRLMMMTVWIISPTWDDYCY